jgi:hypothetical protein
MTRHLTSHALPVFIAVVVLVAFTPLSHAEIPQLISYQGKVTESGGNPVADGSYTMRFQIYDQLIGGSPLWDSGAQSVDLSDGVFNVMLGGTGQPTLNLAFEDDYWLQVLFEGVLQTPRRRLGSVGYSYMASGLVPGTEVSGAVDSGTFAALRATNTATSGESYGLHATSISPQGHGVLGAATSPTGINYGVYGSSTSTSGRGVTGLASATSGNTYGVMGSSGSPDGHGVYGVADATDGFTYGVHGIVLSTGGVGVYGHALAGSGPTRGVLGIASSTSGKGVHGVADATAGDTYGMYGSSISPSGTGVYGDAIATTGVTYGVRGKASSPAGYGLHGIADADSGQSRGVYGESNSSNGVGVYGRDTATEGTTRGVLGSASSIWGTGVHGVTDATTGPTYGVYGACLSTSGTGVYGGAMATTGGAIGVHGESAASSGIGVYGQTTAEWGLTYGVYGHNESSNGSGVYGYCPAGTGVYGCTASESSSDRGVYGYASHIAGAAVGVWGGSNSGYGYGVYSSGDFAASGSKSCVVKTSQGPTRLYCQESAECWFEDFGEGQLVEGRAEIALDTLFLETVTIDESNPMHVFLQPYDEGCIGVLVDRGDVGFHVVSPSNPRASGRFSYRVVAKRKDFEQKRLDYCEAGEADPYLYPELREVELREAANRRPRINDRLNSVKEE